MRHFLTMMLFAAIVAVVFGIIERDNPRERLRYGVKVFVEFVVVGMALAWLLYFIPSR